MRNPILELVKKDNLTYNDSLTNNFTVVGVVNKSFMLFTLLIVGTLFSWVFPSPVFMWLGLFGGMGLVFLSMYKYEWGYWIGPAYGLLEGLFIGSFSLAMEVYFPGIVMQAMGLTLFTFLAMLAAYKFSWIQVTDQFRSTVIVATFGVFLFLLSSMILSFFGIYIYNFGLFGLLISFAFVIIAALNLVLDFDYIQKASDENLPETYEWFATIGLAVTLIWMYIQFLQLLARLRVFMGNE